MLRHITGQIVMDREVWRAKIKVADRIFTDKDKEYLRVKNCYY